MLAAAVIIAFGCGTFHNEELADEIPRPRTHTININTATVDELRALPHIGEKLAERIVNYRETYGGFQRPEELMMVDGISDTRFRNMRHLISVE